MSRKKVILVDHNEWGHAVIGADQAQILEIIDHHRVGGIQTDRETAIYLESISGVNASIFGIEMFKASSNLADHSSQELIEIDLKTFTMGEYKVGIGQVSVIKRLAVNQ